MFKNFLFSLDKPLSDKISDSIDKEPFTKKYWFQLGATIICLLLTVLLSIISIFKYDSSIAPVTYGVNLKEKTISQPLNIIPYPHQSFKNVSSWIIDAVTAAYSFDFSQYDNQLNKASYYFTPDGYQTYLTALNINKVRDNVVGKKLQISIVPMQNPVLINGGAFGNTTFWRFKMPVMVSYYGGKEAIVQRTMIELLVLRVPSYQNYKGLAIAEFNMTII